ncbi:hypothetical protein FGIG_12668, partial [Fasciola gigantica]
VKVYDWLAQLNLANYWPFFREQKLCTFEQIAKLTWEDLEEVGISKLVNKLCVQATINPDDIICEHVLISVHLPSFKR